MGMKNSPAQQHLGVRLGELEATVMQILWNQGRPMKVRDVIAELAPQREVAYTTAMTVLDHLHGKAMVLRTREGRAYSYLPARTREQHTADLMEAVAGNPGERSGAILGFIERLTPDELAELRDALKRAGADQGAP